MPNDAPNANGSNDSSEPYSGSSFRSESKVYDYLDSVQMPISAAAPDGEANEVCIFSKKHANDSCPNDAPENEDPEREERYKMAQMKRPGFSVQGMHDNQVMDALRSCDPALYKEVQMTLKNDLA